MQPSITAPLSTEGFFEAVLSLRPAVAVFDCDGTLWSVDTGYDFMLWSIAEGIVSRSASDWIDSRYRLYRAGEVSEIAMCGEMVQLYDGLRESEIRQAAAVFFRTRVTGTIFPEMQRLIRSLQSSGADLWAVSSTNNWVIEEGLRGFGILPSRILAARAEVVDGVITSKLADVPSDEGKALSLARAGIVSPEAVFGNSIHDAAMLEIAQHPFAVNPSPELQQLAGRNGWPVYFPAVS
jgi:HAD superfamily phosphoserine phosphatase-like hydrolase